MSMKKFSRVFIPGHLSRQPLCPASFMSRGAIDNQQNKQHERSNNCDCNFADFIRFGEESGY